MTDITNYAEALREVLRRQEGGPRPPRASPATCILTWLRCTSGPGRRLGNPGSITLIPILTMPEDDKTHPHPRPDRLYHRGSDHPEPWLCTARASIPPVDVLPSLSRLKDKGIGEGKTREDHASTMNQLFAAYATGKDNKELMSILGEAALTPTDLLYAKFADEFEKRYVNQGYEEKPLYRGNAGSGMGAAEHPAQERAESIKPELIEK